jgi:uncharacterized membrane protein YgdD (TMEM256/DUF423 family)
MRLDSGRIMALAAGLLAIGVLLGAFGTHALRGELPPDRLEFYMTAVHYQFIHALGLLGVGLAARQLDSAVLRAAAGVLFAGIVLFSGSLYCMTLDAPRALGVVTAVGGVALVVGWALFAWVAWNSRQR